MSETLLQRGTLFGHNGWVTQIATNPKYPDMILSASRDKTLIVWKLTKNEFNYGVPNKRLYGHSHFISDVVLSSDGNYALSGSWDKTLRLWDLGAGKTTRRFEDHTKAEDVQRATFVHYDVRFALAEQSVVIAHRGQKIIRGPFSDCGTVAIADVLSVAFSADNRQIVSGSRDKTIKLWNTLAECKFTITDEGHTDWVSCVRFSPNHTNPIIVSAGWDRAVKVWNLTNCKLKINHSGHTGYLNTVTVSPDGSLCASGGKDCKAMLWDLNEGKHLHTLDHNDIIQALCFSPNRYWLCAAFGACIKIWDLESKEMVDELRLDVVSQVSKAVPIQCLSLAWSTDGQTLFAGYSDNTIRVWQVSVSAK